MPRSPDTLRTSGPLARPGRWVDFRVDVSAETIGFEALDENVHAFLMWSLAHRLGQVVDLVLEDAKRQLYPGHGYLTGLMHDTLVKVFLGREVLGPDMVGYDIGSEAADYWLDVEFGHVLRNGAWWEGYHFMANAFEMHRADFAACVRMAVDDTERALHVAYVDAVRSGKRRTIVRRTI